jgi:secreted PhoX family phosphatase
VFEVPVGVTRAVPAVPLKALGRFVHEAIAIDPLTEIVYQTEDAGAAGFYRFVPEFGRKEKGLKSGQLQMLAIQGKQNYDTRTGQTVGTSFPVEWVTIANPDPDLAGGALSCFSQGSALGGAVFRRLEGAWWSKVDKAVYFNATDGGTAAAAQVWCYQPATSTLTLIYESPGAATLFKPDNITISPGGGILLCEDPDRSKQAYLRGLTPDGVIYDFAINNRPGTIPGSDTPASWDEFAGATFSPDGKWLFVNIQTPGITFAITGPWEKGPLGDPPVVEEPEEG